MESSAIRVLLVDDDPEEQILTRRMLSSAGAGDYRLDWVGQYDEAVSAIARGAHDAYLIDYRLQQGRDGMDLLREAKRRGCRAPVILLTGTSDSAIDEQALKEGAADYLVKGQFGPDVLERSLRYAIERHRTEEAVRKIEALFHGIVEDQTDLISRLRADHTFVFANEAYCRFFGKRREELLGQQWQPVAHPEDLPHIMEKLQTLSPETPTVTIENRVYSGSGEIRWVQFANRAFYDQEGRLSEIQSVGRDITERKNLEQALRQKDEHLRMVQKLDAIGRMAGGIAHEFNNILAGIICYADLIQKTSTEPPDSRRNDAREIMALGERAAVLVRQLVTFSQPRPSRKLALSLNDLLGRGAKMISAVCGERIQVTTIPAADLPSAHANPEHLEQVLINLCLNARDAVKGAGRVAIETRRVELKEPLLTRRGELAPGVYACLSVTDSGEGITEENQAKIFDPFFTTKPQGKGSGLGLAVAFGILKEHGGAVDFESSPGQGTTFRIYLPAPTSAARSSEAPASPAAPAARRRGDGELILIADDEAVMRAILKRVLQTNGYATLIAEDGLQAVELFKANQDRVALVLLDVMMPNLDGAKAWERIAALKSGVKVLFMSGYAAAEAHEVLRGRQNDLIAKPFVPEEILQKIEEALGRAA